MVLDEIINSIVEMNVEQLLLYFPIFIIGIGFLVIIITYIKNNWKTISDKFSKLKIKLRPTIAPKKTKITLGEKQKLKIDYAKEVEKILGEKDPTKAMDKLSILVNQYFSSLFNLHYTFTYEELIDEMKKRGKEGLKEFCENLLRIEFSKNEVSKRELEGIVEDFLGIIKEYPLKTEGLLQRRFFEKIRFFNSLKRFKRELQKELEKRKTVEEKVEGVVEKTGKTVYTALKGYFSPAKVPKKVSFDALLDDVKERKKKTVLERMFYGEKPTLESFFYFIYLILRKSLVEKKKVKEIEDLIKKGERELETGNVTSAQALYDSIVFLYNSISNKDKKKIYLKISSFYNDIVDCIRFQKAMMGILQLKLALKSRKIETAQQSYSAVSKLYEELSSKYKNEVYKHFLDLEKEINIAENKKGGNQNA